MSINNNKKLKIGFFIPFFIPAWRFGGSVKVTYETAKKLVEKGHDVTVYCTDLSNKHKERINKKFDICDGIKIYYFRNLSNRLSSKYKIFLPFEMRKVLLEELERLDIIHIHEVYSITTYWIFKRIKKNPKPLFISTRGTLSPYAQGSKRILKKMINSTLKKLLKRANLVFAETNEEKKDCLKFGLRNIQVLNNGIDFRKFDNLPSRSIFRNKYGIKEDDILILFLGRINEIKGLRYLVESISNLKKFPEIRLAIIGPDDRYLSKLLTLIKKHNLTEKVIIIDGLYGMEKIEAYSASDIFCLPSIYDCCPNSMLEACAAGLPIITTKTNGLSCILENGGGIVVPPGNTESIKNALLYFVQNPNRIKDCGLYLKEKVIDNYNWDNTVNILESHYYQYLNHT